MHRVISAARRACVWAAALGWLAAAGGQDLARETVLHIAVVSGEGAVHAPGEHVAKPVTIQVTDGTGRPVEAARVSFQVPAEGPGGVFASGLGTDLAVTDASGRATVRSLQLNRIPGRYVIRVTAAKEQARAGIVFQQYINERSSLRENADRAAAPAAPEKAPPAASSAAPAQQLKPALGVASAAPLPPDLAREPKGPAAAIQPASAPVQKAPVQIATDTAASTPARIPTIVFTRGPQKPIAGAMVTRDSKSHKKWIWLGILAAGGVGGAFAGSSMAAAAVHNSATAAPVTAGISIGTPNVNIGKP